MARELQDPAFYAVHHLSVPAWMLQHNEYSRQGWFEARSLLQEFLSAAGSTPGQARRRSRARFDHYPRDRSITRGPKLLGVETIGWRRTVADVRQDVAEHYCADVRDWAASVVADSTALASAANVPNLHPRR